MNVDQFPSKSHGFSISMFFFGLQGMFSDFRQSHDKRLKEHHNFCATPGGVRCSNGRKGKRTTETDRHGVEVHLVVPHLV